MVNDYNKNKNEVDNDIENKKCFICKNNICNLKMGCGFFYIFWMWKKCIKVNICLNCNKNIYFLIGKLFYTFLDFWKFVI